MAPRILLVDDEDDVRHWLRITLEGRGWEVVEASSGADGLAVFDAGDEPDLIVLDHMMPSLSGLEVADAVRARGYERPIVLFSAFLSADMSTEIRRLKLVSVSKVDHAALFRVIDSAARAPTTPAPSGTSSSRRRARAAPGSRSDPRR